MTNILGISSYYYRSNAAIIQDGRILALIEEGRLSGKKYDRSPPFLSINKVLEISNLSFEDIDFVAIGNLPLHILAQNVASYLSRIDFSYHISRIAYNDILHMGLNYGIQYLDTIQTFLKSKGVEKQKIHFVEHHDAHAASAALTSGYGKCSVAVSDLYGDGLSSSVYFFDG